MVPEAPMEDGPDCRKPAGSTGGSSSTPARRPGSTTRSSEPGSRRGLAAVPALRHQRQVGVAGPAQLLLPRRRGPGDLLVVSGECLGADRGAGAPAARRGLRTRPPFTGQLLRKAPGTARVFVASGARNGGEGAGLPGLAARAQTAGRRQRATTGKVALRGCPRRPRIQSRGTADRPLTRNLAVDDGVGFCGGALTTAPGRLPAHDVRRPRPPVERVARMLERGRLVVAFDLRGHGRCPGRARVPRSNSTPTTCTRCWMPAESTRRA